MGAPKDRKSDREREKKEYVKSYYNTNSVEDHVLIIFKH